MKILIYNAKTLHHKNAIGLKQILDYLNIDYVFTNQQNIDMSSYDIIYSPSTPISKMYNSKFIYGPHFSVFPDHKLQQIPRNQRAIYIQPSEWAKNAWGSIQIPLHVFAFPVDTQKFSPKQHKTKIFVYTKRRNPKDIQYICDVLKHNNIEYILFDYLQKYREEDYLNILQHAKYGIIIDAHESQGFALEEALSCNVPLLVWNVKTMNQEWNSRYREIPCSSIPYWDGRCGEFFYKQEEFIPTFQKFLNNLLNYKPRDFIIENLSLEPCARKFQELIKKI